MLHGECMKRSAHVGVTRGRDGGGAVVAHVCSFTGLRLTNQGACLLHVCCLDFTSIYNKEDGNDRILLLR